MSIQVGVIGYPISHSLSPVLQQAAFDALVIPATYRAYAVRPDELGEFVAAIRADDWLGVNVTVPHKEAVIPLVDELLPVASAIGAVNTIIRDGNRLLGDNTDAEGFLCGLKDEGFNATGSTTVIVGAGGAARACVAALTQQGAETVYLLNRSSERANALAAEFGPTVQSVPWSRGEDLVRHADLLVNATTVGMVGGPAPDKTPVPADWLAGTGLVYDLVYRPAETPLLFAARRAGVRVLGGLPMLVYQGAAAFTRWTGRPAPVDRMFLAVRSVLQEASACFGS